MITISIIVCTRNRASKLDKTLHSLTTALSNTDAEAEVVIVNNASSDHTSAVVYRWSQSVAFPVRHILESNPGLSHARNAGITAAKGHTFVFTDDDCVLNPDYLVMLTHYLAQDTSPVIRGGKVELGDPTDLPFTILLDDEPKQLASPVYPPGFIIGANMVIPRAVIEQIGVFDTRFGAGSLFKAGEESDLIYRAYRAGIPVHYVPDLIVQHFHGRKDKEAIVALIQGYFIANGALYAKHLHDTFLLRHLYWDVKYYLSHRETEERLLDKALGITYGQFLKATFKGMALYGLNRVVNGKYPP